MIYAKERMSKAFAADVDIAYIMNISVFHVLNCCKALADEHTSQAVSRIYSQVHASFLMW